MPFHPAFLSAFALLVLAPFIGSFLGTLILRLPEGRPVFLDRSRCEACGHVLSARDATQTTGVARRYRVKAAAPQQRTFSWIKA